MNGNSGPIKVILIGENIVETVDCHATCDSEPVMDSGERFKIRFVLKRNATTKMKKKIPFETDRGEN
jgi:hypothetical protein